MNDIKTNATDEYFDAISDVVEAHPIIGHTMTLKKFGEHLAGEMAKPAFREIVALSRVTDEMVDRARKVLEAHRSYTSRETIRAALAAALADSDSKTAG